MKTTKKTNDQLLVTMIELMVRNGYDISRYVKAHKTNFNREAVEKEIERLENENN